MNAMTESVPGNGSYTTGTPLAGESSTGASPNGLPLTADDLTIQRLEDQIDWYNRKSRSAQRIFKRAKVVEILAAAMIPFLAGMTFRYDKLVTAGLGVLITILEGVLHLNQYQQLWNTYRSTCEALKHEKYTYLAKAGPYACIGDPRALLAERIESLVSQEHAQWSSIQQPTGRTTNSTGA